MKRKHSGSKEEDQKQQCDAEVVQLFTNLYPELQRIVCLYEADLFALYSLPDIAETFNRNIWSKERNVPKLDDADTRISVVNRFDIAGYKRLLIDDVNVVQWKHYWRKWRAHCAIDS